MAQIPEDSPLQVRSRRLGVFVAVIAVFLGGAPYMGKAYLRSMVPPVLDPGALKINETTAMGTMQFLENQRQKAFESVMSLATQMDAGSRRGLPKKATSFREAVTTLGDLDLQVVQALKEQCAEEQWPFRMFHESESARSAAERRAQHLNNVMMASLTLVGAGFLVLVLRSHTLPNWARGISMMAAGAIIAGWFPL